MRHHKGQSFIEYTIMAVLIMLGIVVMGPYALRSINAHYKIWGESIDDTLNDRMQKVNIHPDLGPCVCTPATGGCGARGYNILPCKASEQYHFTDCKPGGCGLATNPPLFQESCVENHDYCCSQYNACSTLHPSNGNNTIDRSSCCGTVAIPTGGARTGTGLLAPVLNNGQKDCYVGEELFYNQCGSSSSSTGTASGSGTGTDSGVGTNVNVSDVRCQINSSCKPKCLGDLPCCDSHGNSTATLCPGTDQKLTQDTPLTLLGYNGCATANPATACLAQCNAGYQVQSYNGIPTCVLFCGNGKCDADIGENCFNCPQDCGAPITTVRISANDLGAETIRCDERAIQKACQAKGYSTYIHFYGYGLKGGDTLNDKGNSCGQYHSSGGHSVFDVDGKIYGCDSDNGSDCETPQGGGGALATSVDCAVPSPYCPGTTPPSQPCAAGQVMQTMPDGKQYCGCPAPAYFNGDPCGDKLCQSTGCPAMDDPSGPFRLNDASGNPSGDWYVCYAGIGGDGGGCSKFPNERAVYDLTTCKWIGLSKNTCAGSATCQCIITTNGNCHEGTAGHCHDPSDQVCTYTKCPPTSQIPSQPSSTNSNVQNCPEKEGGWSLSINQKGCFVHLNGETYCVSPADKCANGCCKHAEACYCPE